MHGGGHVGGGHIGGRRRSDTPMSLHIVRAAVLILTLSPASARLIAVVRPTTPAPITRTSMSRPYPVLPGRRREEPAGLSVQAYPQQDADDRQQDGRAHDVQAHRGVRAP